jgi:DEAD/DEAH box helicase domain-containing protein
VALVIAEENPLDSYFVKNPNATFLEAYNRYSDTVLDPESSALVMLHAQCAAFELPLNSHDDVRWFGERLPDICREANFVSDHMGVREIADGLNSWFLSIITCNQWIHPSTDFLPFPASNVSIRMIQDEEMKVFDSAGTLLEEMELRRAIFSVYDGGVYLYQGKTFVVQQVNFENGFARVKELAVDYMTRPRDFTDVDGIKMVKSVAINVPDGNLDAPFIDGDCRNGLSVMYGDVQGESTKASFPWVL